MKASDLEDMCVQQGIAVRQRQREIDKGLGTAGTDGYAKMGCYECSGFKGDCPSYYSKRDFLKNAN